MENKINIPNVPEDERIGSAFNHLFHVIRQTEACTHEEIIWDLKGDSFFHPFFLAPLLIYKQECEKKIQCINYNPAIKNYLDLIQGNDAIALKLANEGRSTKNLPETENRGYGISSSKKMLVEGLQGSFFMLSGNAFHRYDTNGSSFIKLPESIQWNGTIILMRIPVNVPNGFNYSKYVR